MCRFLLVQSARPICLREHLEAFAAMTARSTSPEGDRPEDGWGIAWEEPDGGWAVYKSLSPAWEDADICSKIPESRLFMVHARSASFREQKGRIDHVQPFTHERRAFVFNGFLKDVSISAPGEIGSQKIWNIVEAMLKRLPAERALDKLRGLILARSALVQALNIGLAAFGELYALSYYSGHGDYYRLWGHRSKFVNMVCSEPLDGLPFSPLPVGRSWHLEVGR
jgi:predicted glutamine amidotransferase